MIRLKKRNLGRLSWYFFSHVYRLKEVMNTGKMTCLSGALCSMWSTTEFQFRPSMRKDVWARLLYMNYAYDTYVKV